MRFFFFFHRPWSIMKVGYYKILMHCISSNWSLQTKVCNLFMLKYFLLSHFNMQKPCYSYVIFPKSLQNALFDGDEVTNEFVYQSKFETKQTKHLLFDQVKVSIWLRNLMIMIMHDLSPDSCLPSLHSCPSHKFSQWAAGIWNYIT